MTNSLYRSSLYDGFQNSPEILQAIAEVAGEGYAPPDADLIAIEEYASTSPFYRLWSDPTEDEERKVKALAWSYADPEDEELYWGQQTIRRP